MKTDPQRPPVFVDGEWTHIGERRWRLRYYLVRPDAMGKDEIDTDSDVEDVVRYYASDRSAVAAGKKALAHPRQAYGDASVQEQVVDWFVEADGVAEWRNEGEERFLA